MRFEEADAWALEHGARIVTAQSRCGTLTVACHGRSVAVDLKDSSVEAWNAAFTLAIEELVAELERDEKPSATFRTLSAADPDTADAKRR